MGQPGCRVYVATPSGFQQYISDYTSTGGWSKDPTIISSGSTIAPNSPITAMNNYDVGGSELNIFFVTNSNQIVYQSHNNGDFQLHTIPFTPSSTPKFLTSVTWHNTDGCALFPSFREPHLRRLGCSECLRYLL